MPKTTDRLLLVVGEDKYLVEPGKLLLSELIAAEKATGLSWAEIWIGVNRGYMQAVQAVVWLMRKRSNPKLRISEVEFKLEDYWKKDPDFDPDYWIPEGDDDQLPDDSVPLPEDLEESTEGEAPKDTAERPQDTPAEE